LRDQVFISYSHKDERWLQKLRTHLKPFERTHQIQVWDDNKIRAGDKWRDEIGGALKTAKVAVLLVSPNFLASDFITDQELPELFAAAESEGLKVIWVAVSASAYMETSIRDYQAANDTARPLDCLKPAKLNEELVRICEAIKLAISDEGVETTRVKRAPGRRARSEAIEPGASLVIEQEETPPAVVAQRDAANLSKRTGSKRKLFAALAGIIAVVAVGGVFAYSKLMSGPKRPPPVLGELTNTELDDEFLNLNKWTTPPTGWTIDPNEGQGRLVIEKQPQVGCATGIVYGDFELHFNLKLLNQGGAAWALRADESRDNYYLFYLSGPGGKYSNRFLTYMVRDGVIDLKSERSNEVIATLKEGAQYQIDIKAEKNKITHTITPAETGIETKLHAFDDPNNTLPRGGICFRTVGDERFSVDDLFAYPAGAQAAP
jgi:hypothetical protein